MSVEVIAHKDIFSSIAASILEMYINKRNTLVNHSPTKSINFIGDIKELNLSPDTNDLYLIGFPTDIDRVEPLPLSINRVIWIYPYNTKEKEIIDNKHIIYGLTNDVPRNIIYLVSKLTKINIWVLYQRHKYLLTGPFGYYEKEYNNGLKISDPELKEVSEALTATNYSSSYSFAPMFSTKDGKQNVCFEPQGVSDFYKYNYYKSLAIRYNDKKIVFVSYPTDINSVRAECSADTIAIIQLRMEAKGNSLAIINTNSVSDMQVVKEFLTSKGFSKFKTSGKTGYATIDFSWKNILTFSEEK